MPGIVELVIIFAVSWWVVFLPILGIGTTSQQDNGDVEKGTEAGAPINHMLPKKVKWASIGAAIITIIAAIIISVAR